MEAKYKIIFLVILALMWGGAQWANADDEISCATDNECIKQKVDAGYDQWEASHKQTRSRTKVKAKAQREQEVKPCAADDDCQRSKLDAVDRENGVGGQED